MVDIRLAGWGAYSARSASSPACAAPYHMMKSVRRYKHVSRPCIRGQLGGWVAQKRGVGYRARFASELKAAQWLAKEMGVSVASLRIRGQGVREKDMMLMVSLYHGVVAARGRWEARVHGQTLGRFDSEVLAARCVAKHRGVTVKSLKKGSVPPHVARRIFKVAYKVFHKYRPGDYESMVQQEMDAARMFQQVCLALNASLF